MNFSIRPMQPGEWKFFRDMRLKALQMHPGFYAGTYEAALKKPPEEWQDLLASEDKGVFGLFADEYLIGITGIFPSQKDPNDAVFVMSFIEPDYRGLGLSKRLYEARIEWARAHGFKKCIASHRGDNIPSRQAMVAYGFQLTHEEQTTWPDGRTETEYHAELVL
ncbi:MAG: GNAT family N-acetyltransferase [Alphaproteobacteria bacterium]|nr:GNAT family N-acetyltransferase [Alphaproteobacteria bacterium]